MIERYSRKELTSIWSEENKYKIWLDVEIAAAQAMVLPMAMYGTDVAQPSKRSRGQLRARIADVAGPTSTQAQPHAHETATTASP